MRNILRLFKNLGKKEDTRPIAAVFVDYEHWFISLNNLYHMKPDLKSWLRDLSKRVNVKEITFFGDFSKGSMENEVSRIREVSNRIIETGNNNAYHKKDFTDFIMLDCIYQKAMYEKDIDTFVLFTGDGHFASVVSFLVNGCKKIVGVFGIKDAFSNQLKNTATWFVELPTQADYYASYYKMILSSLNRVENKKNHGIKATFRKTVEVVSDYYNINPEIVRNALQLLIDNNYIQRIKEKSIFNSEIMTLKVNWEMCENDGYWISQKDEKSVNYFSRRN